MKWSFLLFSSFLCLQAIAQYPATGNKMRLGWQTTGDGLVYRGAIGDTATLDPSGLNNAWMLLDTANGNLYAYRAKAWRLVSGGGGSVSDTLTGEVKGPLDSTYIDTVANIIFRLDSTAVGVGEVKYNDTQGSIQQGLKGGNVTNVIGQQLHQRVLNKTGSPLAKGEAVYLQGSQGNRITVAKAIATIDSTSANTFGIVAESIADNQSGYVITEGLITNMNTNALTEGAAVYLSPTVAGELTTTKPQAPQHTVYIGVCVKQHTGSGELFVKIRNGQELDELHDVRITSPDSSASLYYNAAQGVWRDTTGAVLTSDTSVFARDFQINGTANYLAKFTGSNAVGNSVIQDNGTNVGISASPSSFKLDINGSTHTTGDFYADRAARSASAGFVSAQTNNRWLAGMISNSGSWHVYDLLRSTSVMTLDSATGNVGINTTTPAYRLDVNGDVNTTGMYKKSGTDIISGTANRLAMFTGSNTVGNSWFSQSDSVMTLNDTKKMQLYGRNGRRNYLEIFRGGTNTMQTNYVLATDTAYTASTGTTSRVYTHAVDNQNADYMISTYSGGGTGGYILLDALRTGIGLNNPVNRLDVEGAAAIGATYAGNSTAPTNGLLVEGNVGIATSSPSRPLHVNANSSMIIPSGATGTRPASGADGDLRYSTTFSNIEFYRTDRWMRPLVGTVANNKVAFASGDTLTSNTNFHWDNTNTKLGIGNATPDSTLTVTGGIRATRDMYARRYNVSTFTGQVLSINNYAPAGSPGFNIFMGNGGENLNWANGENASYNIGIGFNSLLRVTTAQGNIGIGVDACRNITSGINNIAIGVSSLANTTIANDNFGLGAGTLFRNTIGSSNTAIGNYALLNGVTASSNTGIGLNALYNNTGNNNVGIGTEVLFYQTAASNNSAFGYQAGSRTNIGSNNETSSNSIYIGYDTRASTSGNQNEIVIGYQGRGNGSNTTTIGNSSTTATFFQYGETYIGTATDNGAFALQVGGTGYFSTGLRVDYTAAFDANTIFQMPNTSTKAAKGYAWNTYSDARIKSNFDTIQNALQAVQALKPVYYDQHDSEVIDGKIKLQDGKTRTVGFIAQDVALVIPAAVQAGNDTQLWGMDYTKLIPYLTKAIQEQQAQIEALKKEIEALKNK